MSDDSRQLDLPEHPVGNRLYDALTDPASLTEADAAYVGGALGRIEQRLDGQTDSYTLSTDDDTSEQLWVTKGEDGPVVETYEQDDPDDPDIQIFGSAFDDDITQLFDDASSVHRIKNAYRNYSPADAPIR